MTHQKGIRKAHGAAQAGQHKGVAAQAGGGVHHIPAGLALHADGLGHRLAAPAAKLPAMRRRALDKFGVHRPVFVRVQQAQARFVQLQPVAGGGAGGQ